MISPTVTTWNIWSLYWAADIKTYCPKKKRTTLNKNEILKLLSLNKTDHFSFKSFLNIPESSFVYFFLGRMDKSMGIDFLIENAEKILNIGENVYLILAGAKGSYSVQVNELSNKYDRIKYYENIPFDQKLSFYHACDVYLAPTMQKHACMGVSIKEAMACGKPIIAYVLEHYDTDRETCSKDIESFLNFLQENGIIFTVD